LQHVADLRERAKHLNELAASLKHLAGACEGDGRPECPIIRGLEGRVPQDVHCPPESHAERRVGDARRLGSKPRKTRLRSRARPSKSATTAPSTLERSMAFV
jgi:hypothetical protein